MIDLYRRIDDLGRFVLPKSVCRTLGLKPGDEVKLSIGKDGVVTLSKAGEVMFHPSDTTTPSEGKGD